MKSLFVCVLFVAVGVIGGEKVLQDEETKLRGAEASPFVRELVEEDADFWTRLLEESYSASMSMSM